MHKSGSQNRPPDPTAYLVTIFLYVMDHVRMKENKQKIKTVPLNVDTSIQIRFMKKESYHIVKTSSDSKNEDKDNIIISLVVLLLPRQTVLPIGYSQSRPPRFGICRQHIQEHYLRGHTDKSKTGKALPQ